MNSTFQNAEQPKFCSNCNQNNSTLSMETPKNNSNITINENLYTIEWSDIENTEIDYDNYLNDIENFFREDFDKDIFEENIY